MGCWWGLEDAASDLWASKTLPSLAPAFLPSSLPPPPHSSDALCTLYPSSFSRTFLEKVAARAGARTFAPWRSREEQLYLSRPTPSPRPSSHQDLGKDLWEPSGKERQEEVGAGWGCGLKFGNRFLGEFLVLETQIWPIKNCKEECRLESRALSQVEFIDRYESPLWVSIMQLSLMKVLSRFPSAPFKRNCMEQVAPGPKGSPEPTPWGGGGGVPGIQRWWGGSGGHCGPYIREIVSILQQCGSYWPRRGRK